MKHKIVTTLLALALSQSVVSATFKTKNFTIEIQSHCEEGNVSCSNIQFLITPIGSKSTQTYTGTTWHSSCKNKSKDNSNNGSATPCTFQGYSFSSDTAQYTIYATGVLQIKSKDGSPLLVEKGKWLF